MSSYALIKNVKKNRCLFDKKHAYYFNKIEREKAWNDVSREIGKSIPECQSMWKALRERFSRELKKQKALTGSGESTEVDWELFDELLFLKDSVKPRRARRNRLIKPAGTTSTQKNYDSGGDGFFDDTMEECFPSSTTVKKRKVELDVLMDQFGIIIQKLGDQLVTPTPIVQATDDDAAYLQTMLSLMKDLPIGAKNNFKSDMIKRVVELRTEHESSTNQRIRTAKH